MRSEEEIRKKLRDLLSAREEFEKYGELGISNLNEYNMAIKVLKWVLGEI